MGDRFYTYTLTGTGGTDFSRKVFVNGTGNNLVAGGPAGYETLKAEAVVIGEEIRVVLPPLSALYILIEPGTRQLSVNNEVTSSELTEEDVGISIRPNPSGGTVTLGNLPSGVTHITVTDIRGAVMMSRELTCDGTYTELTTGLVPGIYFITFSGNNYIETKKLIIK